MRKNGALAPRSVLLTAVIAVLVTAGVLSVVIGLRRHAEQRQPAVGVDAQPSQPTSDSDCGGRKCVSLATVTVNGTALVLLADTSGGAGRIRVGPESANVVLETTITAMGARLSEDSLRCAEGPSPACLIRGVSDGGMVGEVLSGRGGNWRAAEKPYFSDAGNISLSDVTGDSSPEVIVVRHECSGSQPGSARCEAAPVLASVYDQAGQDLGCSGKYTSPSRIRGWPDVRLSKADLRPCP